VCVPIEERDEDGVVRIAYPGQSEPTNAREAAALLRRIAAELGAGLDRAAPDDQACWRTDEAQRYLAAARAIESDGCVGLPCALRAVIGFAGVREAILEAAYRPKFSYGE
jgi:hypothetical protein